MKKSIIILAVVVLAVVAWSVRPRPDPYADWQGNIVGVLAGGAGLVVRPAGTQQLVEAYMAGDGVASVTAGDVHIRGRTTGTSCAYLATVFSRCHPEVEISSLEPLMNLTSPAFNDGDPIPALYTCDGAGTPPPLVVSDVPAGTASLSLVVTDPDAPSGTFTHWVLTGLAPDTASISGEGFSPPCPPSGTHRYIFTLTAHAADGSDIATARLMGTYARTSR